MVNFSKLPFRLIKLPPEVVLLSSKQINKHTGIIKGRQLYVYCYAVDQKGFGIIQTFIFYQQLDGRYSSNVRVYGSQVIH